MINQHRIEPRQLLRRYALAISLLVVFVMGGHGIHLYISKQGALDEEVINISGLQRMLSQRIILLAHRYNEEGSNNYAELLEGSLKSLEANHNWIMQEAVIPGSRVGAHFVGDTGAKLDVRVSFLVQLTRDLLNETPGSTTAINIADQLEDIALVGLLREFNIAVSLFEDAANKRSRRLEQIQLAAVTATLMVLLLVVLVIFYPAHRTMSVMIDQLRRQAWEDQLTGLANRTRLISQIDEILSDGERSLERVFVMALDLDGFKEVNDTLGHPVGDQVLQHVAKSIEDTFASDQRLEHYVAARLGGDEFLIFGYLSEGDLKACAKELSAQLIAKIEKPINVSLSHERFDNCVVGVSIGFAFGNSSEPNMDVLLSNADIALYESKNRGKGIATAFETTMREAAETKHRLSTELKSAVKGLEFSAFFQPQIELATGALVGVEALARWEHPDYGLIAPEGFLKIAEEALVIDALDGQIMLSAFEGYNRCIAAGFHLGKLSLNASGVALRNTDFCETLVNVARAHNIPREKITVEVLETVLIQENSDPATETIQQLSRAGIGVAIDDFGVGYSSLSRIAQVGISAIKLDRSLVRHFSEPNMDNVLKATASMAKGMGATLLAEGIETEAQHAYLRDIGVEVGQGFLWSRPVSVEDLKRWLESRERSDVIPLRSV